MRGLTTVKVITVRPWKIWLEVRGTANPSVSIVSNTTRGIRAVMEELEKRGLRPERVYLDANMRMRAVYRVSPGMVPLIESLARRALEEARRAASRRRVLFEYSVG